MAPELGHLATNSVSEEDAEKAAQRFRKRLKPQRDKRTNVPRTWPRIWLPQNIEPNGNPKIVLPAAKDRIDILNHFLHGLADMTAEDLPELAKQRRPLL
jgi:hypothetical protein